MQELADRAKKVWSKISSLPALKGEIVIFGHGLFTAVLFAVRDGVAPENFAAYDRRWEIENCKTHETTLMIPPQGEGLEQDSDTLDTWFSSALWPFSTLGWPDTEHADFRNFFPTSILETGHDILFFWVARMIMFSLFATGKEPFHTVYLHGLVCDEKGQKMSKSKGNGIDPLKMIEKFGTDALRMSMVVGTTPGNPINLGEKKVEGYRNFANKLWNVARFILSQTEGVSGDETPLLPHTTVERWMLSRTQKLVDEVTRGIEEHRYGEVGQKLYEFTWNELADWGIEGAKADPSPQTPRILREVLKILLTLLHPYTPFVTEKIWHEMQGDGLLALQPWPEKQEHFIDETAEKDFSLLQEIVTHIRSLRSSQKVEPAKRVPAFFSGEGADVLARNEKLVQALARLEEIAYGEGEGEGLAAFVAGTKIFLPLGGLIDPGEEKKRFQKELAEAQKLAATLEGRLRNEAYVAKAPPVLVAETKREYEELLEKIRSLKNPEKKTPSDL